MKLVVLGSGTALPHPRRGASGYACIADDGTVLLLECGPGSTRRWSRHGITLASVGAIAVTHHHLDHCSDLAAVLFARNATRPPVEVPLLLVGPPGHEALIRGLHALYGPTLDDRAHVRSVVELRHGATVEHGPFHVEARAVAHGIDAVGLRVVADGRTLAFGGDSAPSDGLAALCTGADLALLECSYPAGHETTHHMTTETVARTAVNAGVTRLVLTHFYPACDQVDVAAQVRSAGYDRELHVALDDDTFLV